LADKTPVNLRAADFCDAEAKGRWWRGGRWLGDETGSNVRVGAAPAGSGGAADQPPRRLRDRAFDVLGECYDATEGAVELGKMYAAAANKEQRTEVVRAIIDRCCQEKKWNEYYWDVLKLLQEMQSDKVIGAAKVCLGDVFRKGFRGGKDGSRMARNLAIFTARCCLVAGVTPMVMGGIDWDAGKVSDSMCVFITYFLSEVFAEAWTDEVKKMFDLCKGEVKEGLADWGVKLTKDHAKNVKGSKWRDNYRAFKRVVGGAGGGQEWPEGF
ncbi:hypothetical protein TeGR_g891, partial [Tetraparma gracilis]